jgi:hypothetical protein
LSLLETAITDSGDNLDTDVAAVWTHNKNEVRDRTKLFKQVCRNLCEFLGFEPGPKLGTGELRIVRC